MGNAIKKTRDDVKQIFKFVTAWPYRRDLLYVQGEDEEKGFVTCRMDSARRNMKRKGNTG